MCAALPLNLLTFKHCLHFIQETTGFSKQPIRTRYLGRVTGYQPINDQYLLSRSVPATPHPAVLTKSVGFSTTLIM